MANQTRLIFGCGYLGRHVAQRWLDQGDHVCAVTRSNERAEQFSADGFTPIVADVTDPSALVDLPHANSVLYAVGYDRRADKSIDEVYQAGMRNVLEALPNSVERIIYISTTGVYGDAGGDWIDEQTPPDPQRPGGIASLGAEEALRQSPFADRGVSLRLAGIYGPDRLPYLAKLRAGEPIEAPQSGWLNLIHVDDAAAAVVAAADVQAPPKVVCVSDGDPPQRGEYYAEVARLLDAPPPRFGQPEESSPRAKRAQASKRVRNDLMRAELGVRLAYPTYREGLKAIVAQLK